jgi:SpoIID/LytB domain protein
MMTIFVMLLSPFGESGVPYKIGRDLRNSKWKFRAAGRARRADPLMQTFTRVREPFSLAFYRQSRYISRMIFRHAMKGFSFMKRCSILICALLILFFGRCAFVPPTPESARGPEVRIGLVTGAEVIEFSPTRPFVLRTVEGQFIARGDSGERWLLSVQASRPGKCVFRLVAGSMSSRDRARGKAREVESFGYETEIQPVGPPPGAGPKAEPGAEPAAGSGAETGDKFYRVYLKKDFKTDSAARAFRDSIRFRFDSFLVKVVEEPASGLLRLTNPERNLEFETDKPVAVIGSPVTLMDVPVGAGFHWEQKENRTYPETVGFQFDSEGKAAAVNTVSVETYLEGVIPSEMHPQFAEEALKAQAVAARSKTLATLGLLHTADPFDFCADVHCQVYSGLSRISPSTTRAVKKTAGLVLWENGRVADAVYSSVCGGHTEDADKAWKTSPKSYLQGVIDGPKALRSYAPLDDEMNVRKWILDSPDANCNMLRENLPDAVDYTRKYFRWEVTLQQAELRAQVEKRIGRSIGSIRELLPLSRGDSGRITKLKIMGSDGEQVVEGELAIRRALSASTLWSSCFFVEKKDGASDAPDFVLKGAGWGHGIGMCQTGAEGLALKGKKFDRILKQYFQKAQIKRIY